METFRCAVCYQDKPVSHEGGTGYGRDGADRLVCYRCCGISDAMRMRRTGRATLYLEQAPAWRGPGMVPPVNYPASKVSNWPGTLSFRVNCVRRGRHNIARVRYDFTFTGPDKAPWVGVQYGDNTQIAHCRRVKRA